MNKKLVQQLELLESICKNHVWDYQFSTDERERDTGKTSELVIEVLIEQCIEKRIGYDAVAIYEKYCPIASCKYQSLITHTPAYIYGVFFTMLIPLNDIVIQQLPVTVNTTILFDKITAEKSFEDSVKEIRIQESNNLIPDEELTTIEIQLVVLEQQKTIKSFEFGYNVANQFFGGTLIKKSSHRIFVNG